jgi:hypothetical protein
MLIMSTKKTPSDIKLNFTGKMSVIVELEDHGPLEFRIHDMTTVKQVVKFILELTDYKTPVNGYGKNEEKRMQKLLDDIT